MLFLLTSPMDIGNITSQIKYETFQENSFASTRIFLPLSNMQNQGSIYRWDLSYSPVTNLVPDIKEKKVSTWEEIDFEEFDIVVKFQFATKHKILAKINNISKYNPLIILD